MSVLWAEKRVKSLFRPMGGERWLEWELNQPLQEDIKHQSFATPARTSFYNAIALVVCGHLAEARLCLDKAEEIIQAAFDHERDPGTWGFMYDRRSMLTYLYVSEWLLRGRENADHLTNAATALEEGMRRALADGLGIGPEGFQELALLRLVLGDGESALAAAHKMAERPLPAEPQSLIKCKPTGAQTLALAAHSLVHPNTLSRDRYRQAIDKGVLAVVKKDVAEDVGNPDELFLWLRLREQVLERTPDPWEMLRALPGLVDS